MKIIGLDIDGTLCPSNAQTRSIPDPTPEGLKLLRELYENGYSVYIWTCRATYLAEEWLRQHGIRDFVCGVNESPLPADDRKLPFHAYIGDDAITWDGDVHRVLHTLEGWKFSDYGAPDLAFCSQTPPLYLQGVGLRHLQAHHTWPALWNGDQGAPVCLLTICSHAKPYAKSFIHMSIRAALHECGVLQDTRYAHISSAGIIPTEAGTIYPYCAYDWDNRDISDQEVFDELFSKLLRDLADFAALHAPKFGAIVVYLRETGNTARAAKQALSSLPNVKFVLVPDSVLPHALDPDPDDTLTAPAHLELLKAAMKESL